MSYNTVNKDNYIKGRLGVTLISLSVMVIVMIILASAVAISVTSISKNSKIVAFSTDLSNIEGSVESYYVENNILPKIAIPVEYTKATLSTLSGTYGSKLEDEIDLNIDTTDKFFEIDLAKLKLNSSVRGLKKTSNDIYVVNSRNLRVYYVKGYKIGTEVYFSLTDKLIKSSNIQSGIASSAEMTLTLETDGIKIIKSNKEFTNNLGIIISSVLENDQKLRYSLAGTTAIDISGNSFASRINLTTMTAITDAVANFTNISTPIKTIVVEKVKISTGAVIAKATMNIDNLDIQNPVLADLPTPVLAAFSNFNTITFSNISDLGASGIKEIKYEYYKKINSSSVLEDYLNPAVEINEAYLVSSGKKVVSNIIKLDKHISSVKMICIDNAGNISDIKTYTVSVENLIAENQSKFLAGVLTYRDRVLTDLGGVVNLSKYNTAINFLKSNSMYDSLALYFDTYGGMKTNTVAGVKYIQTVYDFKGSDLIQATPSLQPKLTNLGIEFSEGKMLTLAYNARYNIRNAITISVWFKRTTGFATTEDVHILSRQPAWYFYDSYNSGFIKADVFIDGARKTVSTSVPFDGNWYQLTFTYDSTTLKLYMYKNGALSATTTLTGLTNYLIDASTNNFGAIFPPTGRGFIINEGVILNRALTAIEVLEFYQATKNKYI